MLEVNLSGSFRDAVDGAASISIEAATIRELLRKLVERYPRMRCAVLEAGSNWITAWLDRLDHKYQMAPAAYSMKLTPSETFRRQIYVDFWFEFSGVELRHKIGIDNIMWESDYPHVTSTYPNSWKWVERVLEGVPKDEREKLLCTNAAKLYKLQ
ncbi:MAG: amidohydrolase family protein [Acidobacteria bacterium]|nr:amidohydrolase family protein [Acidobacteriota bacterium]